MVYIRIDCLIEGWAETRAVFEIDTLEGLRLRVFEYLKGDGFPCNS